MNSLHVEQLRRMRDGALSVENNDGGWGLLQGVACTGIFFLVCREWLEKEREREIEERERERERKSILCPFIFLFPFLIFYSFFS